MVKPRRQFSLLRVPIFVLVCLLSLGSGNADASRKKPSRGQNGAAKPGAASTTPATPNSNATASNGVNRLDDQNGIAPVVRPIVATPLNLPLDGDPGSPPVVPLFKSTEPPRVKPTTDGSGPLPTNGSGGGFLNAPTAKGKSPPPVEGPSKVRADIPSLLLERRRSPMRGVSLPGPLKAFVVSMLHVSFIPRSFPREFAAPWVKDERKPNASERAVQVALLQELLHSILEIYDNPKKYDGPAIKDYPQFLSVVAPTEGDPHNSVKDEFEYMLDLLRQKDGLDKARRIDLNEHDAVARAAQFENPEVRVLAQEREYLQTLYLKATLRSLLAAGTGVNSASYVIEVLIGSFVESLIQNPTDLTADLADTAAEALDGKPLISNPAGQTTEEVSKNPLARGLRTAARLIRSASDYRTAEAAFLDFLRLLCDLKGDSLGNVIVAFEKALEKVVQVFETEAKRLVRSNEMFSSDKQKEKQAAILKLLMERYPLLLPQDVLKNIILDLLVMPIRPDLEGIENNEMMDVVLSHSGPLLTNLLQRSGNVARSGGFLKEVTERLQNANRPIPLPALRRKLQEDPNKYFAGDIPFEAIPDSFDASKLEPHQLYDRLDPKVRGAGKFYLNYRIVVNGKRRRIKVQRPDVRYRLDVDHEIFRFLAPDIGEHFLPRGYSTDRNQIAQRMQRQIDIRFHALQTELDADQTARNQREAYDRFNGRSERIQTEDGVAEFVFEVPYCEDALPGSLVVLMDEVRNIVDLKDFVSRYPGLAKQGAEALYSEIFQQLVWSPLELGKTANGGKVFGIANRDSHAGNILIIVEPLAEGEGHRVRMVLIDWGLTSTVGVDDLNELLALGFGAGINDPSIISSMLWKLSNVGRSKAASNRARDRARELSAQKKALYAHVAGKVGLLNKNQQYWGPADWIYNVWIHGLVDFPPHLAGLHDVIGALDDTMVAFNGMGEGLEPGHYPGEEKGADPKQLLGLNVITRMEKIGRWPAIEAAGKHLGLLGKARAVGKGIKHMAAYRARSCWDAIAMAGGSNVVHKFVDPNE